MSCSPERLYQDDKEHVAKDLQSRFMQWTVEGQPDVVVPLPVEEPDTDFKREFPPDPFGREADDNARVWKIYRAQATTYDSTRLDAWNGALDILLLFAGLFSAVTTAFLIESYQSLQFDKDGFVVNALYALVVDRAAANRSLTLPFPPSVIASPSLATRWINMLWFTSLVLALAVSLLSILVKQWLREYISRTTASAASPRQWAHRRQLLHDALITWRVAELISILPLLLHAALFLFLAGIVVFLWGLDKSIALVILLLAAVLGAFYTASILIPLWLPICPTSTPLVQLLRESLVSTQIALSHIIRGRSRMMRKVFIPVRCIYRCLEVATVKGRKALIAPSIRMHVAATRWLWNSGVSCILSRTPRANTDANSWAPALLPLWRASATYVWDSSSNAPARYTDDLLHADESRSAPLHRNWFALLQRISQRVLFTASKVRNQPLLRLSIPRPLEDLPDEGIIRRHVESQPDDLDASSLLWLIATVSDSDSVAAALQAVGALRPSSRASDLIRESGAIPHTALTRCSGHTSMLEMGRVAKTLHNMATSGARPELLDHGRNLIRKVRDAERSGIAVYPDLFLLGQPFSAHSTVPPALQYSPTATSTIMALLHSHGADGLFLLEYCDLRSGGMDWETVQTAAGVRDTSTSDRSASVLTSLSMIVTLNSAQTGNHDCRLDTLRERWPKVIIRLMSFSYPDHLSVHKSDYGRAAACYGTSLSHVVDFLGSAYFPTGDPDARTAALDLLKSATCLYSRQQRIDETSHAVKVALSLLLRFARAGARTEGEKFVQGVYAFLSMLTYRTGGSPRPTFLPLFVRPICPSEDTTTVWKELWNYPESSYFLDVVRSLLSWLADSRSFGALHLQQDIEDSFFGEIRLIRIIRLVPTDAYASYGVDRYTVLLQISRDYRRLRPAIWLQDIVSAATTDTNEYVRALALELQCATEEGRDKLRVSDVERRLVDMLQSTGEPDSSTSVVSSPASSLQFIPLSLSVHKM